VADELAREPEMAAFAQAAEMPGPCQRARPQKVGRGTCWRPSANAKTADRAPNPCSERTCRRRLTATVTATAAPE
jgi:hypothetical protein